MVFLQEEQARMRSAIEELTKRRKRKRRYIPRGEVEQPQTVGEISDLLARDERKDSEMPAKRVRGERRCGRCKETGHNTRTCTADIELETDSDASEE